MLLVLKEKLPLPYVIQWKTNGDLQLIRYKT
jgi:hypothetical protein